MGFTFLAKNSTGSAGPETTAAGFVSGAALLLPGQYAPSLIHVRKSAITFAESGSSSLGMRWSRSLLVSRWIIKLAAGFPGTTAGPLLPPARIAFLSSRWRWPENPFPVEWQE